MYEVEGNQTGEANFVSKEYFFAMTFREANGPVPMRVHHLRSLRKLTSAQGKDLTKFLFTMLKRSNGWETGTTTTSNFR